MSSPIIPRKINPDDLTRLTEMMPRGPFEEKKWVMQYLKNLSDNLGSISVSKKTLEKLKTSLHKVQATGKDDDSQFGKTIASLANRILHTLTQHEAIAASAATKAKPLAAKAWLQERLGQEPQKVLKVVDHIQRVKDDLRQGTYTLQDHLQILSEQFDQLTARQASKEELASLRQKICRAQDAIKSASKEMNAIDKELDILKKEYPLPEAKPAEQDIKDRLKKLKVRVERAPSLEKGDMQELIESLKELELSTSDLDPKDNSLGAKVTRKMATDTCDLIDKRLKPPRDMDAVLNNIESLTRELHSLQKELPFTEPQKLSGLGTHPVYLLEKAALKEESAAHELFLNELCELLGPGSIVPSMVATIKTGGKFAGTSHAKVTGVIQPLVERATGCNILRENRPLARNLMQRFDIPDSQRKIFIQELLAAWDLHAANGSLVPKVTPEYLHCEEKSWEYQASDGTWKPLPHFINLVSLSIEGVVTEKTKVRNDGKESTTRTIGDDAELQKALNVRWQFAFFDNARTLGNEREPTRANPNHLQLNRGEVVLPTRLFPLGLPVVDQPLEPEVKAYILSLQQKREALEKVLFEGDWTLWQHVSPENAQELRELLKSDAFAYSSSMLSGGSKMELLDKIPPVLLNKIMQDLKLHKITTFPRGQELQAKVADLKTKLLAFEKGISTLETLILKEPIANDLLPMKQALDKLRLHIRICLEIPVQRSFAQIHALLKSLDKALDTSNTIKSYSEERCRNIIDFFELHYEAAKKIDDAIFPIAKAIAERDRFATRLFPHLDRVQGVAFLERIDRSIAYLKTCERNCKEFDATAQIPTDRFGALEYQAYQILFSKAFDAIQKSPISEAVKEDFKKRFEAMLTELLSRQDQGPLDAKTFNALVKLLHDCRQHLEPSLCGVHGAMFPYFEPFFGLLTMVQASRTLVEDPKNSALLKAQLIEKHRQLSAEQHPPQGEKEAIFVCIELLDTIQQFITSTVRMSNYRNFPYTQWGDAQARELKAILQNSLIFTSKSKIDPETRREWDKYLKHHMSSIDSALIRPFTQVEHKELVKKLSYIVKKIYNTVETDNLEFLDSQEVIFAFIQPVSLQDIRSSCLLEKRSGFLGGGYGYAFEDCGAILQTALQLNLFPEGKNDPKYKELLAVVEQTKAR